MQTRNKRLLISLWATGLFFAQPAIAVYPDDLGPPEGATVHQILSFFNRTPPIPIDSTLSQNPAPTFTPSPIPAEELGPPEGATVRQILSHLHKSPPAQIGDTPGTAPTPILSPSVWQDSPEETAAKPDEPIVLETSALTAIFFDEISNGRRLNILLALSQHIPLEALCATPDFIVGLMHFKRTQESEELSILSCMRHLAPNAFQNYIARQLYKKDHYQALTHPASDFRRFTLPTFTQDEDQAFLDQITDPASKHFFERLLQYTHSYAPQP